MVLLAALTSCISLLEAIVSGLMDHFGWNRKKATLISTIYGWLVGIIVALGYNIFYFEYKLPTGNVGQILDIFDYVSNSIMMPVLAFATCILIGWVLGVSEDPAMAESLDRAAEAAADWFENGIDHAMSRYTGKAAGT